MPLYLFHDRKTGKKVEVLRSFADYEIPPTKEEDPTLTGEEEWERLLGNFTLTKSPTWGSKGNWLIFFGLFINEVGSYVNSWL